MHSQLKRWHIVPQIRVTMYSLRRYAATSSKPLVQDTPVLLVFRVHTTGHAMKRLSSGLLWLNATPLGRHSDQDTQCLILHDVMHCGKRVLYI